MPGFSPGSPRALDRVDIATGGGGSRGGGTRSPSPVSNAPEIPHIFSAPPHPRLLRQATHALLLASPTPPAPAALLPRPLPGAGSVRGDIRGAAVSGVEPAGNRIWGGAGGKPYPGCSRWEAVSGSFPPIPWHWTVGISPLGEGPTGRGSSFPLPCLLRSQNSEYPTDPVRVPCRWVPKELAGTPPHPRLRRNTHTLLSAFLPVEDTRTLLFVPPLHQASGMRPVRPHGAVWWSIDRAEVSRACFGRQSLAEPPSPALQPAGGRDGGYIYIGTAR